MSTAVHQQLHGYRSGHQLLYSSVRLGIEDQDVVDHLSDLAGPLRPGERFNAYISAYPLPSGEYFAMARTEQDMDAPRSGCVVTKTLLLPMNYWRTAASPTSIVRLLDDALGDSAIEIPRGVGVSPVIPPTHPVIGELVEALFLEERKAIVVFGTSHAEAIAMRVLTALWPGMRRSFSVCTFTLAPRTLLGRSFDLVFAPRSVRQRFGDWEGRRLEGTRKDLSERHRWTSVLAKRVFRSRDPHLATAESFDVFGADGDDGNERLLRLALLWEELREKAHRSPTAVLGLIDIASAHSSGVRAWKILERVVAECVDIAAASLGVNEAWDFVDTLLQKLENTIVSAVLGDAFFAAGTKLTQRDWRRALSWVGAEAALEPRYSNELLRAVANSVSRDTKGDVTRELITIPPDRLLKIALLEDSMLGRIFLCTEPDADAALIRNVTEGVGNLSSETLNCTMDRFLRRIRGDHDAELLAAILAHATASRIVHAVTVVWGATSRRTHVVGEVLCAAADALGGRREARRAFACLGTDDQTNRCIARLLKIDASDVKWVLEEPTVGNRRAHFLSGLINGASSSELEYAFERGQSATAAIRLLVQDLRQFGRAALRMIGLPGISAKDYVELGLKIPHMACEAERARLSYSIVVRVLTDVTRGADDVRGRVVATVIKDVDMGRVVDDVLAVKCDGEQVSRTLSVFEQVSPATGDAIMGHVKRIVELVARRRDFDLSVEGAAALAKLIEGTKQRDRHTYVELCSTVLRYAMAARRGPASQIIVVAFPVVYDELRNARSMCWLGDFFEFLDWDRCKVARKELVRAFMESSWPPVDLGVTAYRAGDLKKILKRLLGDSKGSRYLDRIERGARRLEDRSSKSILRAIKEVRGDAKS